MGKYVESAAVVVIQLTRMQKKILRTVECLPKKQLSTNGYRQKNNHQDSKSQEEFATRGFQKEKCR